MSDVCLSVTYIVNIHGAHSYVEARRAERRMPGVRRVLARAGPQRVVYRGGGISCDLAYSLL